MFNIKFFETSSGEKPIEDFLNSLDIKMRVKVLRNIEHLRLHGNKLREPYSSPIRDGIFELRTKQGSDITRILYFFYTGNTIVLTNGFIKKTQKTPAREIEKALKYKQIYLQIKRSV